MFPPSRQVDNEEGQIFVKLQAQQCMEADLNTYETINDRNLFCMLPIAHRVK